MSTNRLLKGRKTLIYNGEVNTQDDVKRAISAVYMDFITNKNEIDYLWRYYLGEQDVINRTKDIRQDILKNTVVNHAKQIVSFYTGYTFGEGVQFIRRGTSVYKQNENDQVSQLNDGLAFKDKRAIDLELANWFLATGVGYRSVFPQKNFDKNELPVVMNALDPRNTGIIYSAEINPEPIMAFFVTGGKKSGSVTEYKWYIYTKTTNYVTTSTMNDLNGLQFSNIEESQSALNGMLPIIEYNPNPEKQGVFESVIPILNLINEVTTNRGEAVEQFIQAYWKFVNADITEEDYLKFIKSGAIVLKAGRDDKFPSDVDLIKQELDQSSVQAFVDDLTLRAFQITGVPDRRNSTGGSTGAANMVSNGWFDTDSKVDALEGMFIKSEKKFLKMLIDITKRLSKVFKFDKFSLPDIDIKFSRNKTDNLLVKTQALQTLLQAGIHARVAIATCGLFSDPTSVYEESKETLDKINANKTVEQDPNPEPQL
jgi:SPP1 family phage portal protein